jgi:hypothetical protein
LPWTRRRPPRSIDSSPGTPARARPPGSAPDPRFNPFKPRRA